MVAECEGLLPRSTMRVPQPDIIEHFGNADAVPQPPERCLSRKAGIMRCCLIAIEHARNDKSLTREDLAERIRKSERYVVAIERGERTPSLKTCYQIVRCLGISADKLFYPEATLDENSATREITRMLTSDTLLSTPCATPSPPVRWSAAWTTRPCQSSSVITP